MDLAPITVAAEEFCLRPTLYLGIGGTAGRILWRPRHWLHERFGDLAAVPALQTLLVDTDPKSLAWSRRCDPAVAPNDQQIFACLLRAPHQYREDSGKLLGWLSRRWLYNIPRSLCTDGLRPLGRLALVDHAAELFAHIRSLLVAMTSPDAVAASEKQSGLKVNSQQPRVILLASISGGTGSGMVLDAAYAVRKLLAELGLSDQGVYGILTHSTGRRSGAQKLAVADACACLGELQHYSRGAGYPGDPDCALPPFAPGSDTFHHAYLVPLGDGLDEVQFDKATDVVAKYLFLDTATPAAVFFQKCRESADDPHQRGSSDFPLRTFGVRRILSDQEVPQDVSIESLAPLLPVTGGGRRLLLVVPEGTSNDDLQKIIQQGVAVPPNVVSAPGNDTLLCCEAEQLPLGRVAAALLGSQSEASQLAQRLRTRIYVDWHPAGCLQGLS